MVEIPCAVGAHGAQPLHVGAAPSSVRDLICRVKRYERFTVRAALARSTELAVQALAENPLVADHDLAGRLMAALGTPW